MSITNDYYYSCYNNIMNDYIVVSIHTVISIVKLVLFGSNFDLNPSSLALRPIIP